VTHPSDTSKSTGTPRNVEELDERLSRPRDTTVRAVAACPGDIVILGAGGKMGPTLAMMAVRAARLPIPTALREL